ncbi:MAG TPA: TonB-dependent receptor [Verrucomicrobiae bacterium]|nr:TonB-dependent receptor [Verrucomicrobiae bacterium]
MQRRPNLPVKLSFAAALFISSAAAHGTDSDTVTNDISSLSIEQLMDIKVTILGPTESVSKTPAAVSVLTADDIKRSGAMNIPEALRLVPGLDVAQVDSGQWAISSRGFNDVFANKLLVLEDGRQLYTPLFSGVTWDAEEGTMLDNIDHIEVVRGPGATLWGANAVNGVINIISKNAADTQGVLFNAGGGNVDLGFANVRFGDKIGDDLFYRIYAGYEAHDSADLPNGDDAENSWMIGRMGFRADWTATPDDAVMFEGNGYAGSFDNVFQTFSPVPPTFSGVDDSGQDLRGADAVGRWTHTFSDTANLQIQGSYDHTERDAPIFHENRNQFDLTLQNQFAINNWNQFIWGLEYRVSHDSERNSSTVSFNPVSDTINLYSAFLQDEIDIVPDRFSVTIGSKFEGNDYTGFEYEPGIRARYTPTEKQTFWAAISRAVRMPSRSDEAVTLNQSQQVGPGVYLPTTTTGNSTLESEELIAYEAGYRVQPLEKLSFDISVFYNDYDHIRSADLSSPLVPPLRLKLGNNLYGNSWGGEVSATWRVTDWWRLIPSYTLQEVNLHARMDHLAYSDEAGVKLIEGSSPQNQFLLRSALDLPHDIKFDTALRYVDAVPAYSVEGYFELDARLAWQISKNVEVAIVGQNLLHNRHPEYGPSFVGTTDGLMNEIPRSIYGKITVKF